jgi:hypothetical protein
MALTDIDRNAIKHACEQLSMAFCYNADHGNFKRVGELFSPTGTFDRFGLVLNGPAAIAEAMSQRPEGVVTRHGLLSVYFKFVEPTTAEAVVNSVTHFGFQPSPDEPAVLAAASPRLVEFHDRYQLIENAWRIESRVGTAVFASPS